MTTASMLSPIDRRLLAALEGGDIRSLFQFSIEHEFTYPACHKRVIKLEAAGLVAVERRRGYPLLIRRPESAAAPLGGDI